MDLGAQWALAGPRRTSRTGTKPEAAQFSRGFFLDLVSAPAGVSLYRFQLCLWTLALGCLFVASVWRRLAMPQFSATLLGLMGISSGTYLGAKIPEG